MNTNSELERLNQVAGEFTRIMIVYWDMLGKPPLTEFLSLLPMEPALEHINKSQQWNVQETQTNDYMM
jgi:hypothetical protein